MREGEWAESLPENRSMALSFVFLNLINLKLFILFTINAFKFTMKLSSVKTTMMYIYMCKHINICMYVNICIYKNVFYIYMHVVYT